MSRRSGVWRRRFGDEYFLTVPPYHVVAEDSKEAAAPDFGPFDAVVEASPNQPGRNSGYSRVSQHSRLTPGGIAVSGDWSNYAGSDEAVFSFARLADVTFDVVETPVRFDLSYSMRDPSHRGYERSFDLLLRRVGGDGGDVFRVIPEYDPDLYTAIGTESGTLSPGRYEFRYATTYLFDVGEFGDYDLRLSFTTVPEPASVGLIVLGAWMLAAKRPR